MGRGEDCQAKQEFAQGAESLMELEQKNAKGLQEEGLEWSQGDK